MRSLKETMDKLEELRHSTWIGSATVTLLSDALAYLYASNPIAPHRYDSMDLDALFAEAATRDWKARCAWTDVKTNTPGPAWAACDARDEFTYGSSPLDALRTAMKAKDKLHCP